MMLPVNHGRGQLDGVFIGRTEMSTIVCTVVYAGLPFSANAS